MSYYGYIHNAATKIVIFTAIKLLLASCLASNCTAGQCLFMLHKKVQVGNDQEMAQSEIPIP